METEISTSENWVEFLNDIVFGAGLDSDDLLKIRANSENILKKIRNSSAK